MLGRKLLFEISTKARARAPIVFRVIELIGASSLHGLVRDSSFDPTSYTRLEYLVSKGDLCAPGDHELDILLDKAFQFFYFEIVVFTLKSLVTSPKTYIFQSQLQNDHPFDWKKIFYPGK